MPQVNCIHRKIRICGAFHIPVEDWRTLFFWMFSLRIDMHEILLGKEPFSEGYFTSAIISFIGLFYSCLRNLKKPYF